MRAAAGLLLAPALLAQAPGGFRLPTGLQVLSARAAEAPLVRLELQIRWDPSEEPAENRACAALLAELLARGHAGAWDRQGFVRWMAGSGLELSFRPLRHGVAWSLCSDGRDLPAAFEALALAAGRPSWDGALLARAKEELLRQGAEGPLLARAEALLREALADPARSVLPAAEALRRLGLPELEAFTRRVLRPEHAVLVVHGPLDPGLVRAQAVQQLGTWGPAPQPQASPGVSGAAGTSREAQVLLVPGEAPALWLGARLEVVGPRDAALRDLAAAWLEQQVRRAACPGIRSLELELLEGDAGPEAFLLRVRPAEGVPPLRALESLRSGFLEDLRRGPDAGSLALLRTQAQARAVARALHPEALLRRRAALALGSPDGDAHLADVRPPELAAALRRWTEPGAWRAVLAGAGEEARGGLEALGLGSAVLR